METKLSDTLVKAIDRSNPFMQNLQLGSRFNALVDSQGGNLEDNKEDTIDVSAYTEPVEITPTAGKDGMKKATVTLDNIPSGGVTTLYAWVTSGYYVYTTTATPTTQDKVFVCESDGTAIIPSAITEVGEDSITVEYNTYTYERDATGDIDLT